MSKLTRKILSTTVRYVICLIIKEENVKLEFRIINRFAPGSNSEQLCFANGSTASQVNSHNTPNSELIQNWVTHCFFKVVDTV